jgi:hypothetical protein
MTMVDEMIKTVRAALEPGADAATKQQAAAILRGVLGMLEGGGESPPSMPPTAAAPTPDADLLSRIIEYVRPYVPEDAFEQMPRFRVPIVNLPRDR